jgi:ATP-dependent DNA helicase RecQ
MLTYSRSAALEMKERLRGLVKEAARYVDIYTFHSFAFNLLEIRGDLEQAADIIPRAAALVNSGKAAHKVENKSVLVVDEFQDMGSREFELIRAIVKAAKEIRVVAVGDDDQNIFEFRGSSSQYMKNFIETFRAKVYHLTTNYRSKDNLVQFSNTFVNQLPDRVKAGRELVSAQCGQNGSLTITRYNSTHLITPLVKDVIRCRSLPFDGTTAVLTATNDEALQVYTLLRQQGIRANLLVSYADIRLKSLVELKTFSDLITGITRHRPDKTIDREQWQEAKERIKQEFSRSKQLEPALKVIETFETSHHERENLLSVNWWEYLDEVKLEDFVFPDRNTVFVSTMHKAKGKEFDRVFLLLDNYKIVKDENIRVIYVAVTRARESLNIHTNLSIFDNIWVPGRDTFVDETVYTNPEFLSLQLTHRDVYLDYFTNELIIENLCALKLQAGDRLTISERDPRIVNAGGREVLMFSTGALENLKKFFDKGYRIQSIHAEYMVNWKKKEGEGQYLIVLPRLELRKFV